MRVPLQGDQRKLLVLIAAYADAGERSPSLRELGARLGGQGRWGGRTQESGSLSIGKLDWLLRELVRAGVVDVRWRAERGTRRNVYAVRLGTAEQRPPRGNLKRGERFAA